ncbi:tRNA (adenosine(37)-N6)-threonylcarbamoyltransferase complex dimerization subunit type 1 TsaB [Rubinisphaera brasiliensis]|uniref:Universal protein YeaZ n=1 Tax=Rubinisphaera brasiliensis (strain ATCC 49424 / DSM 5305 / JCM 21570 / IAM 15109 / NBRC 103401 / IFAM 1448) TaxID=756272 RepID=F0SKX3_RUBBR|nr:tRNA (adenosine(37)-N6)-threonylcarbamoyltransferase complex dimerization subunit type 1 TsaB [Rubinisphaera brasiliensis]ADY59826.1 universal protein YeaZ [Rubinisphaera brasiliensis DSM 5305]
MLTLAIETSGSACGLALVRGQDLLQEIALRKDGRPETNRLVSSVQDLFKQHRLTADDLDLITLSAGPGSFTGLRAAFTFAKTFAFATGRPVKAVGSFAVIAEQVPQQSGQLEVVEDLRQSHVATQTFTWGDGNWEPDHPVQGITLEEWQNRPHADVLLAGGLARLKRQLPGKEFPAEWSLAPEEQWMARAPATAAVGQRQFDREGGDDPFRMKPLYVRRSAAEEAADRGEI